MNDGGRMVVVIGVTGDVGTAVSSVLAERDIGVIGTSRHSNPARSQDLLSLVEYDAGDDAGLARLRSAVRGRQPVALVYCAGIGSSKQAVVETSAQEWAETWRVNVLGFIHVVSGLMPELRATGASVVAVSSQAADTCRALSGPYNASKRALEAVAVTLAKEEAHYGVRVNVVSPSLVRSQMAERLMIRKRVTDVSEHYASLAWGRALEPSEVAQAIVAIALDDAWAYATGHNFPLSAARP